MTKYTAHQFASNINFVCASEAAIRIQKKLRHTDLRKLPNWEKMTRKCSLDH